MRETSQARAGLAHELGPTRARAQEGSAAKLRIITRAA